MSENKTAESNRLDSNAVEIVWELKHRLTLSLLLSWIMRGDFVCLECVYHFSFAKIFKQR